MKKLVMDEMPPHAISSGWRKHNVTTEAIEQLVAGENGVASGDATPCNNNGDQQMKGKPVLTNKDHDNMDAFLGHVLDDYKAGVLDKTKAVEGLAHVMGALDLDNYDEVRVWFEQGRKLIHQ